MIVIDYSQVAISIIMAELQGRTDVPVSLPLVRHMLINAIRSYKMKFGSTHGEIVIACDDRKYWRKEIFPHYKANRKKSRDKSGYDWPSIFEALNAVKQELSEHFPYPVIEVSRAEADDVIASLVYWSQKNDLTGGSILEDAKPKPLMIMSQDHDFQQLQKYPNVSQYAPVEKKNIKNTNPAEFLLEHILRGDVGDGVPNFLSVDDTFVNEKLRQKPMMTAKVEVWKTMKVEEFLTTDELKRNFERNQKLVDLSFIPQEIQDDAIRSFLVQRGVRDRSGLLNYFTAFNMPNLIEHLGEF